MKIIINTVYGGFGLSQKAFDYYNKLSGGNQKCEWHIDRDDPYLIQVVEEMGDTANGGLSALKVVEIPDDVEWEIEEYDGAEHIAEKHRTWR